MQGAIREVKFNADNGMIIAEVSNMEEGRLIAWEVWACMILVSACQLRDHCCAIKLSFLQEIESTVKKIRMVGQGQIKPSLTSEFRDDSSGGTQVILTYNFHRVMTPGSCCGNSLSKSFPKNVTDNFEKTLLQVMMNSHNSRALGWSLCPCPDPVF